MRNSLRLNTFSVRSTNYISKRIVLSYLIDWFIIIVTVIVGGAFSKIQGNKHAFSLNDPDISFPHKAQDTVPYGVLIAVALGGPALITACVSLLLVPGPTASRNTPRSLIWRRKLWEWNTAWMGLGVAVAGSFMITEGLKDLTGKPRPDLLARCQPDTSPAAINKYRVGGLEQFLGEAAVVVDWHICQNKDLATLRDGFASWPSGHSSFSWAGLLYLTLWLCSKFAISIPFLAPTPFSRTIASSFDDDRISAEPGHSSLSTRSTLSIPPRNQAAAPPVHLLIIAFIPIGTALFICVSRWSDYRHAGFDIISGAVLGALFAWLGFRWYHLPLQNGAGWSWGARSRDRAFYIGVGVPSYVGDEGWESEKYSRRFGGDLEQQRRDIAGGGVGDQQEPGHIGGLSETPPCKPTTSAV